MDQWTAELTRIALELWRTSLTFLPRVVGAAVLVLAGWLVARLLRLLAHRLVRRVGRWGALEEELRSSGVEEVAPRAVSALVFWTVMLATLAAAGQALGLGVVSTVLSQIARYLPSVISGVIIVIAGVVLGNLARHVATTAASTARLAQVDLMGSLARVAVLALAGVIALEQFGVNSTVLVVALGMVLGGGIGGITLAFALGSRGAVSDLVAGRRLGQLYRPGQLIRVGETRGRILQLEGTAVVLETDEGRAVIPARLFTEQTCVLLDEEG